MISFHNKNLFKNGRNVPLSLTIAAVFLFWSLNWGFLVPMPFLFQMIWSLIYLYAMVNYSYTLNALVNRLVIVLLLILLKITLSSFSPESMLVVVREEVPLQSYRLPLQVLAVVLDSAYEMVASYLGSRNYWAIMFLVIPGLSFRV
jgi:hypothetical protein